MSSILSLAHLRTIGFDVGDAANVRLPELQTAAGTLPTMSEQLSEALEVFNNLDKDGTGAITRDVFKEALRAKASEGRWLPDVLCEHGNAAEEEAWLDFAYAYALYFQGSDELEEAIEFLEGRSSGWRKDELRPFLYTSNWWQLALFHCESRDTEDALGIFDSHLWADVDSPMCRDPIVQGNALNLLWRLETRGASQTIGKRWAVVLAACENVTLPGPSCNKAPLQHKDLLLDVLLVRALCARGSSEVKRLDQFLAAVEAHAVELRAAGGSGGEMGGNAYSAIVRNVAALYRKDLPEAGAPAREGAARKELRGLRPWDALGGSELQRCILLEAVDGPIVCGEPERNFSTLFFD